MKIPFTFHPRVFEALGQGLITSNLVAAIELVKNSYDAFASVASVTFKVNNAGQVNSIEILDDGHGMSKDTITNVWCQVATPNKLVNKYVKSRRVTGEKGLGRLSAAKLGNHLELLTKTSEKSAHKITVHWPDISKADKLSDCKVELVECDPSLIPNKTGTLLRITFLNSEWTQSELEVLGKQLSRLISPFSKLDDFQIDYKIPKWDPVNSKFNSDNSEPVKIEPPSYLEDPPYKMEGSFDGKKNLSLTYSYQLAPSFRTEELKVNITDGFTGFEESEKIECGPFKYEIRAWDIGSDALSDYAHKLELSSKASEIRRDIKIHSGISLFRDHILALPKSDKSRDWLGLDLRRVSRVGSRLSTSQLVGFVTIGADSNPNLKDTSDREGIENNKSSEQFKKIIIRIVWELEKLRDQDRSEALHKEPPFRDLFAQLRDPTLLDELTRKINAGDSPNKIIPLVKRHAENIAKTSEKIEQRVIYYSRLASLGALASFIVHEVRNQVTAIAEAFKSFKTFKDEPDNHDYLEYVETDMPIAERALTNLISVADHFAPLASRSSKYGDKVSCLEDILLEIFKAKEKTLKKYDVRFEIPETKTELQVNPGDLFTILYNLIDNSIYWLTWDKTSKEKLIRIGISKSKVSNRAKIALHDTGPGIADGFEERIFWPGVTSKGQEGVGMGLTVCAELCAAYNGRLELVKPGKLRGASFFFDLPLKES